MVMATAVHFQIRIIWRINIFYSVEIPLESTYAPEVMSIRTVVGSSSSVSLPEPKGEPANWLSELRGGDKVC